MTVSAAASPDVAEIAALLAAHAHKLTRWSPANSLPFSVCVCEAETPLTLPEDVKFIPDAELTRAERAAHAQHLSEVVTAADYRHVGAWEIVVPRPNVLHKGPNDTDASFLRIAAKNIEGGYPVGGSNLTHSVLKLLRDTANSLEAAQPS